MVVVWVRGVCLHPLDSKHTVVSRTLSFVLPSPRPAHVWLSKHHWQSEGDPKEQEQVSGNGCEGGGGGGGLTDMGAARSNTMLFNHSTTAEDAAREQARQRERQATSLLKSHQPAATLIQNTVIICIQSDPHICPPISQPSQAGFFFFFGGLCNLYVACKRLNNNMGVVHGTIFHPGPHLHPVNNFGGQIKVR